MNLLTMLDKAGLVGKPQFTRLTKVWITTVIGIVTGLMHGCIGDPKGTTAAVVVVVVVHIEKNKGGWVRM